MSAETNVNISSHPDPSLPPNQPAQDGSKTNSSDSKSASILPTIPEMPGVNDGKRVSFPSLPNSLQAYASKTDDILTRLNKLIKSPGGLASLLSTANYTLYLLAYLHMRSPTRAQLLTTINTYLGRPVRKLGPQHLQPTNPTSPLVPLGSLLSETRATLRLVGLLPLYVMLTNLVRTSSSAADPVGHSVAIVQCLSFIAFTLYENTWHLSLKGVIPKSFTASRGGDARFLMYSCRAWTVALTCEFVRLFRTAARANDNSKTQSVEEREAADKKWWNDFFVASCWFPMAIHYATEKGIGLNLGSVGALGMFAGLGSFRQAWAATKA